jgi:MFS family permease
MITVSPRSPLLRQLFLLALGLLVFAGGVILARAWLPEWRPAPLPAKRLFADRYRELAARAGARLATGEPRISATQPQKEASRSAILDRLSPDAAVAAGGGLLVEASHRASLPAAGSDSSELAIDFLPSGAPWALLWGSEEETVRTSIRRNVKPPVLQREALAGLLLHPGERLGAVGPGPAAPGQASELTTRYPVLGSRPPQQIQVRANPGGTFRLTRQFQETGPGMEDESLSEILLVGIPVVAGCLTAVVLLLVLISKRRIDFVGGAWIAGFLFVTSAIAILAADPTWMGALSVLGAFFVALWVLLLWSVAESFLRAVTPGAAVSLDALRTGRLGPRGGRSLVSGVAFGALLAGLRLASLAVAVRLPGAWPEDPSLRFPLFGVSTPFSLGVMLAAGVAIAMGLADRFLPPRWAPWAATLAAGLAVPFATLRPAGWEVAFGVAAAGLLVFLGRRTGLAGLLVAVVSGCLLPVAAFTALHLSWFPVAFAVSAGTPVLLLSLGLVGMGRPEWAERERVRQPAFIRRQEDERRLRYEMDLLARMQLGLLPTSLPQVPGWEIAVRSLLATEAGGDLYDFLLDEDGGLWIAAGDVAGHGYSCAIVQAMTAAALTSIVAAGRAPSEVLQGVDRVIRRGGSHRNFTSLALVRLDPATGQVTMSNAGHPFPLLLAHDGEVEEISLPGLPLGQGPQRRYADLRFEIPPGGALVFCSDGLFEATDLQEVQYGYERPRELLRDLGDRPAPEILEALLADWRGYMRSDGPPSDDTTVLVVKRKALLSSAA